MKYLDLFSNTLRATENNFFYFLCTRYPLPPHPHRNRGTENLSTEMEPGAQKNAKITKQAFNTACGLFEAICEADSSLWNLLGAR